MLIKPKSKTFLISAGFSLIELLIVLAIIGILSSIVLLSMKQAYEAAYFAKAKKELRSVYESLEMYKNDHDGKYPADVDRDIPPGLEKYLAPGIWPDAA